MARVELYQDRPQALLGAGRMFFAGPLAGNGYIHVDDCIREALDAAGEVHALARGEHSES